MTTAMDMAALRERDPGFYCAYCMAPLALPLPQVGLTEEEWTADGWELYLGLDDEYVWQLTDGRMLAHRDHVDPRSRGGTDGLDNLVLACERCNVTKGASPLVMFLATRAGCPRFRSVGGDHRTVFAKAWAVAA